MHTLVAFSESKDAAGVFERIAAVPDQHVKTEGDGITIPDYNTIIGAHGNVGALGNEIRLVSPSLRRLNPLYIAPLTLAIDNTGWMSPAVDPSSRSILDVNEILECEENGDPAAPEQHTVGVFLAPGAITPEEGNIFTANATITAAQIVSQWVFSEINFIDELPVGAYAVVGAKLVAAGGCLFRFVPVGEAWRPGGPISQTIGDDQDRIFRSGRLGRWFNFQSVQPPGVEILGSAAAGSATYQLYIDLMPL